MSILHWLRPPRHLLVLFVGTTFALLAGLGWLGWRSVQQDRAVEVQRIRARLEASTDLIAVEIRQELTDIDEQLLRLSVVPLDTLDLAATTYTQSLGDDAVVTVFADEAVRAFPSERLLYYPAVPMIEDPFVPSFAVGEEYEFASRDYRSAIVYFQHLADEADEPIRAGALVRLARNQRKAGQLDQALATYRELARMKVASVGGRPAELVARRAQCALLEELGRRADLRKEADQLVRDLHGGRWRLTRATYLYFAGETERWLTATGASEQERRGPGATALSLAAGVDLLWDRWQRDRRAPDMLAGRSGLVSQERAMFLMWRGTADRLVALVAGPGFLKHYLVDRLEGVLQRQGVGVVLADGEGRSIVSHELAGPQGQSALRTMADTRLPWTLRVVSADPREDLSQLAARRRLLLGGLGFLALLVLAGSYFSARAMTREIEAARLQADFVAAVSHEFRTPLTLLRQFSDLLAEGRVTSEEERHQFYAALQRGTRRLTGLVENVLDFRRTEAGTHVLVLQPLRAKDWMARVTAEFQQEMHGQGYRLEVEWNAPDGLIVRADEAALGRAVWNLLDNAVKYSPECKTIWVNGSFDNSSLKISVRDLGIGVPAEEQRRIFGKFVRGSSPLGRAVKGTGLGLALVEQIVGGHHGHVRVDSSVGKGSTFSIHLPAHEQ
jgi:signal transduction histidine kinase